MTTNPTPLPPEGVTVTQADREAAAAYVLENGNQQQWARFILAGSNDEGPTVQAFARHRIAATSAEIEALRVAWWAQHKEKCIEKAEAKLWFEKAQEWKAALGKCESRAARLKEAVTLTIADASHHLKKYRPHCLDALSQALDQGAEND